MTLVERFIDVYLCDHRLTHYFTESCEKFIDFW